MSDSRDETHRTDPAAGAPGADDATDLVPRTARPAMPADQAPTQAAPQVRGTASDTDDEVTQVVARDQLASPRSPSPSPTPPAPPRGPGVTPAASPAGWSAPPATPHPGYPAAGYSPAPPAAGGPSAPSSAPGYSGPPPGYTPPPTAPGYPAPPAGPAYPPPLNATGSPHPAATPAPGYGPPPGGIAPPPGPAGDPSLPPPPRDYRADARNALNRGNSFLGRLLRRGVNGELLRSITPFQSYRVHKPGPLTAAVFIVGLVLGGVLNQSGGLLGVLLCEVVWIAAAYVLIAIGTKGALQTVAYGIGALGAASYALAAVLAFSAYSTLSSLPYSGGMTVGLLMVGVLAVVLAVAHGYVALQVHREIAKIAAGQ